MAPRRRKIDMELIKAVDTDDTLTILKAQRVYLVDLITSPDLNVKERVSIMPLLTRINVEIQKIDGTSKDYTGVEMDEFNEIEEFRL